jgi:hypothetical protein
MSTALTRNVDIYMQWRHMRGFSCSTPVYDTVYKCYAVVVEPVYCDDCEYEHYMIEDSFGKQRRAEGDELLTVQ